MSIATKSEDGRQVEQRPPSGDDFASYAMIGGFLDILGSIFDTKSWIWAIASVAGFAGSIVLACQDLVESLVEVFYVEWYWVILLLAVNVLTLVGRLYARLVFRRSWACCRS